MRFRSTLVAGALLFLGTISLHARVITQTGSCVNGGMWIVVTTLDNLGRVTSIRGTNCNGVTWTGHCDIIGLSSDPTGQIDPGYPVYSNNGSDGSWVRYTVDEDGAFRVMWGRDTNGAYWSTSNFTSNFA